MLDAFEIRLADMVADGLAEAGAAGAATVVRPRDDLLVLVVENPDRVMIAVQVLSASPCQQLGDDSRERLGRRNDYRLRTTLHFDGAVALDFLIAPTPAEGEPSVFRSSLLQMVDLVLVLLHAGSVRNGEAFRTEDDLGFELDGFRLDSIGPLPGEPTNIHAMRAVYRYSGRFWPVEALALGETITSLPTRIAVLPIQIPENIRTTTGGEDARIAVPVDLRAFGGAPIALFARMEGASPPGQLIGDATDSPGIVSYAPTSPGTFTVVYRPPSSLSSDAQVRIALSLSHPQHKTVDLGRLTIKVAS